MVYANGTIVPGPPLDMGNSMMCVVKYEDTVFSIGGAPYRKVWRFNFTDGMKRLEDGPEMSFSRYVFTCGIFKSIHHSNRPILVVAGSGFSGGASTSEFLDFTQANSEWKTCSKNFTEPKVSARMTPTFDGTGLVMTHERGFHRFQ